MAPPDDYGWAYIDAQRATASADGPSGSVQFRWGSEDLIPGQFSGSEDLVFYANSTGHTGVGANHGTGSALYLYGNLYVTGAIHADTYSIRHVTATEVDVSGSTTFGDDAGDTHKRTGSLEVSNTAVFSANVQAAEYLYHQGDLDTFIRFQADDINVQAGGVDFIKITEDGSQDLVRINSANADVDFIVSTSQSSGSLKIDGATGDIHFGGDSMVFDHDTCTLRLRPMVGATSNQAKILLHSQDTTANDEAQLQFLRYTDGTFDLGDNLGTVQFRGAEDEDGTYYTAASIVGEVDEAGWADGSSAAGRLLFYTTADGATTGTKRMEIGSDGAVEITGSLEVSTNAVVSGELLVAGIISHIGDSDTKMLFGTDSWELRNGGTKLITTVPTSVTINAAKGDVDFIVDGDTNDKIFHVQAAAEASGPAEMVHISGTLGPVSGSGEIHAATFVGNDAYVSGTIGIGTASPDVSLDVKASAHGDGIQIEDDGTTTKVIKLKADSAGGSIELRHIDGDQKVRLDSNGNSWIDGGNVGIGTQSPSTELDVDGDITVSGELLIGGLVSHIGDSDTKMLFGTDSWELRNGGTKLITTVPTSVTINAAKGDVDFIVDGDTNDKIFHIQAAAEASGPAEMVHISGTLGPVSGSGEIHVAKVVANDMELSGTLSSIGYLDASNSVLNPAATFTLSGSSYAVQIAGGMSASHAVKVEHLYTNDLYVSGTAYGITVDRANYASASDTGTTRTYSPSGFETSGYLYVSGSTILGGSGSSDTTVSGDLTVGALLKMPDNTSLKILVADGTSFQEVAVGGDVTISVSAGTAAVTIANDAVETAMLNDNIISGQNELVHANIADADELMISDGGTLMKVGVDSLRDHYFGVVSGDATIADGGALTIANDSVQAAMLNDDCISGFNNIGANVLAQADELLVSDGGTLKAITFSNLEDAIFANISGDATAAAGGALTIAANAVQTGMVHDDVATELAGAGLSAASGVMALDIDELSALGGTGIHQTDDHFVFSDAGTEKKITFSNLQDAVFATANLGVSTTGSLEATAGLFVAGATVLGGNTNPTHQVTGSFEVSGPANFTSVVNAEAALNVAHLLTANLGVSTTGSLEASEALFVAGAATVGGLLTVNGSTVIGTNSAYAHQFTGSTHMAHSLDVTGAVGVVGTLTTYSDFRATDDTQIGSSNTNTHMVSGSVWMSEDLNVTGALHTVSDLDVRGHSTFGRAAGYEHKFTGSVHVSSKLNVTGTINAVGNIVAFGDLNVASGSFNMPDNTSAKILVADGTSYQEVAVSNHITIASNGAVTIANDAVDTNQIADDAIEAAQIADGAIGNVAVDDASLRADKLDISNSTDIGEALADDDVMNIANTSASANRKTAVSRFKTYTKTDIGTVGTAEASKAVILDASKNIATLGTVGCGAITSTGASTFVSVSGSSTLQVQGSASFGAPVDISGDLVFHAAATAGRIDIKVNDGAGADTAIQIGKNGIVTKIGDDTPSDGQYLSWDNTAGKVAWADGLTSWGMSGSDNHYSSTELRTSGDLKVSGSVTFGAGTGLSGSAAGPGSYLVLDANNQVKMSAGSADYTSDNAEIVFGSDSEVKLVHDPDAGLIVARTATGANNPVTLTLKSGETAIGATDVIGKIEWKSSDDSGSDAALALAEIQAMATATHSATVNSTALIFKTATDGAPVKHLELDADGTLKGYASDSETWSVNAAGTGSFQQLAVTDRIIHTGDTNTGIFFAPNDTLRLHAGSLSQPQITINSTEVVINDGSNSLDFRIESNGYSDMFFVDGGNNKVTIAGAGASALEVGGGYGDTGITLGATGSMKTDGHIQADGGFFTVGNIQSAADIFADNITITGDITATSAAPSFASLAIASDLVHVGDPNTKISFDTDQIDLIAGNITMLTLDETTQNVARFNSANADVDFIVSTSQSSGSLYIDGGTGDVHIGGDQVVFDYDECALRIRPHNTTDQAKILLHSKDTTAADEAQLQFLRYTDGSLASGDNLGIIQFKGSEDEDGTYYTAASIVAEVDEAAWTDGSSAAGRLLFYTTPDGSTTGVERLRIDNAGLATFANDVYVDGEFTKDITIHTAAAAQLNLISDAGQSSVDFYGRGDSMSSGDNVGALRFYGTEADDGANSALTAMMIVETAESGWAYGSSLATRMRFQVGRDGDTAMFDGLTIDGSVANSAYPFVGIGTTAPDAKLHIVDPVARGEGSLRVSNTDTGMATSDTIVNLRSADSTFTSSNYWIKFYDSTSGNTVGTINSEVAYSTFTGQHPTPLPSGSALQEGVIIASTGQLAFDGGISNAWVSTQVTTAAKDKAVVGVYRGFNVAAEDSYMGEDQHVYNAIGEGQVLVTDQNGNIETGDYICSSDRAGHGMLQDDDLLHNYTVAKATTPIDFSTVDVDSELGFKSALVPCTYHCG